MERAGLGRIARLSYFQCWENTCVWFLQLREASDTIKPIGISSNCRPPIAFSPVDNAQSRPHVSCCITKETGVVWNSSAPSHSLDIGLQSVWTREPLNAADRRKVQMALESNLQFLPVEVSRHLWFWIFSFGLLTGFGKKGVLRSIWPSATSRCFTFTSIFHQKFRLLRF